MIERILVYPETPQFPRCAGSFTMRSVLGRKGMADAWSGVFHAGVDAGRAEGAALVGGAEVVLAVAFLVAHLVSRVVRSVR